MQTTLKTLAPGVPLTALLMAALTVLAACSSEKLERARALENAEVKTVFNPAEAAYVLQPGSATITGRVYSGTIPGEYARIRLVPVTAYANETMQILFNGSKAYTGGIPIDNVDPRYKEHMRFAQADSQGHYTMHGVPSGRFYVYGTAANRKKGYGFGHMETIDVVAGKKYTVDLDGQ